MSADEPRRLLTAELLSIGSELTVGETRDTNAGELARSLTELGVRVERLTALPDRLDVVTEAFRAARARVDLVVSTGGLGPTPDDLTREAIAAAIGESPTVDPALEAWLRDLWQRRGMPFPEANLKQAWLIPSAVALANPNGTAPGWLVGDGDGPVVVALPGPPREMRPMWGGEVLPRLRAIGLGADVASRTYRLAGIGESQVAELLGEPLLRSANPVVATYARLEAVDVRVSAVGADGRSAESLVEEAAAAVLDGLRDYVWAMGTTTWSEAIGARLDDLGWTLAAVEIGTGGSVGGPVRRRAVAPVRRVGLTGRAGRGVPPGHVRRTRRRSAWRRAPPPRDTRARPGWHGRGTRRAGQTSGRGHGGLDRDHDPGRRPAGQPAGLPDAVPRVARAPRSQRRRSCWRPCATRDRRVTAGWRRR